MCDLHNLFQRLYNNCRDELPHLWYSKRLSEFRNELKERQCL